MQNLCQPYKVHVSEVLKEKVLSTPLDNSSRDIDIKMGHTPKAGLEVSTTNCDKKANQCVYHRTQIYKTDYTKFRS